MGDRVRCVAAVLAAAVGSALSGPTVAQAPLPQSKTSTSSELRLLVSPLTERPGATTLIVTGGREGLVPIVALSATETEPIDAALAGTAAPGSLAFYHGAPFDETGVVKVHVPKPSGGPRTLLYAQAIGLAPAPDPGGTEEPTGPTPVTFIGGLIQTIGVKRFCLENFDIDDPLCSITNLGPNVGMMFEDGFGYDQVYTFRPGATYTQTFDGQTGAINAQIESLANPGYGWNVSVIVTDPNFPGDPDYPPLDSPYIGFGPLKNCPSYLATNGGPIDTSLWKYFETSFGTLTGIGGWAGAQASLNRFGPSFQIGLGANTANLQIGLGAWFDLVYLKQPTTPNPMLPTGAPVNCELFGQSRPCPNGGNL